MSQGREIQHPSTFSCKVTMAVTGIIFGLFVFAHMLGNMKAWIGPGDFNAYALWLRTAFMPLLPYEGLLWTVRVVLIACLVLHLGCGVIIRHRGRLHRGAKRNRGDLATRSMLVTGFLLLAFIVFHLLDLTIGSAGAASFRAATTTESFAYQNLVASFARPWAGGIYLATMLVLGVHLAHGLWASATDLGVTGRRLRSIWKVVGYVIAILVVVGNATLPIGVWTGVLR